MKAAVDIEFFYDQCLQTCWYLRNVTEALRNFMHSGIPHRRWLMQQYAILEDIPTTLSQAEIRNRLMEGGPRFLGQSATQSTEIIVRAAYVYSWAIFDDMVGSAIAALSERRPDLVSPMEAKDFTRWKHRRQLALLRRIGFKLKPEWSGAFRDLSRLRNLAAHDRAFPNIPPHRAHNQIGEALGTHGFHFMLAFCRAYSLPFRFFVPIPGCKDIQLAAADAEGD